MKKSLIYKYHMSETEGKKRKRKVLQGFEWTNACQQAFEAAKRAICENAVTGGDPSLQYHLATDASGTGLGGVLFQLPKHPPNTNGFDVDPEDRAVVMYMSYQLTPSP